MVVITGYPKTGTSILFQCLQKSGLNGGDNLIRVPANKKHLISEDDYFSTLNIYLAMVDGFVPYRFNNSLIQNVFLKKSDKFEFPSHLRSMMYGFLPYLMRNGINLLKDARGLFGIKYLFSNLEYFRKAKYILTVRDKLEACKSFMRQRIHLEGKPFMYGNFTTKRMLKVFEMYIKELEDFKCFDGLKYYELNHSDLINQTNKVKKELSEFLEIDVDLSLIDKNKVWRASKR
jgi:hypothetical protein